MVKVCSGCKSKYVNGSGITCHQFYVMLKCKRVSVASGIVIPQTFNNLCTAIAEHRWNDAFTILPLAVTYCRERVHAHFMWKLLHLLMIQKCIPRDCQVKILLLMFQSEVKEYEVALDWLAGTLHDIDHSNLEAVYQKIAEDDLSRIESYFQLEKQNTKRKTLEEDNDILEMRESAKSLGLKASDLLHHALGLLQNIADRDVENKSIESDSSLMCEWLLAPLLDLEEILSDPPKGMHSLKETKRKESGLPIMKEYMKNHMNHLPALTLFYEYLKKFHPEKENEQEEILKTISAMCPDHHYVLEYVKISIAKADENSTSLIHCVSLLTRFVEYAQWQQCPAAWRLLTSLLRTIHAEWVECWDCKKCKRYRKRLKKLSMTLTLWPTLFWNSLHTIQEPDEEAAELLVHASYAAFIFAYDIEVIRQAKRSLGNYKSLRRELKTLVRLQGARYHDLLTYIKMERKQRFSNMDSFSCVPQVTENDGSLINIPGMSVLTREFGKTTSDGDQPSYARLNKRKNQELYDREERSKSAHKRKKKK